MMAYLNPTQLTLAKLIEAGKLSKTVMEGKWTILAAPSFAVLAITNASPEGLNFITSTTVVRLSRIFSGLGLEEDLGGKKLQQKIIHFPIHLREGRE